MEMLSELPEGITAKEEKTEYELFTMLYYDVDAKNWKMTQDIDGELVGTEARYKTEKLPYKYLGWTWMVGDKYHRPFAEDYLSDMIQVDNLSKLNTEGAIVAAKTVVLVDNRGNRTSKDKLTNAIKNRFINRRKRLVGSDIFKPAFFIVGPGVGSSYAVDENSDHPAMEVRWVTGQPHALKPVPKKLPHAK